MTQTLCPSCGHSPIADGAETCPACGEPFAFLPMHKRGKRATAERRRESLEIEPTFSGAVGGSLMAHPGPAAAVLAVGAVLWFLRAGGVFTEFDEPAWTYGVVGLNLALLMTLVLNLGPAKLMSQAGALLQLGLVLLLGEGELDRPRHLLFGAFSVVLLGLVVGEPGGVRRTLGLVTGLAIAAGAVAVMAIGVGEGARVPRLVEISKGERFRLFVPEGYRLLAGEEMSPHLRPPLPTSTARSVGFGNKVRRIYGALTIDQDSGSQLIGGCQEHLRALGGLGEPRPLVGVSPPALGSGALLYELRTLSGAAGRLGCGKLADGRFVALAMVAQDPDPRSVSVVFEQIGAALSLK